MPIKYCKVAKIREGKIRAMNGSVTPFGNKSVDDVFFRYLSSKNAALALKSLCSLRAQAERNELGNAGRKRSFSA